MFFEKISEIENIASRCGTAIFVVPRDAEVKIKNAIILKPEDKSVITIEQVRAILQRLRVKQIKNQFIIIRPAELLNMEAANALLKILEEPGDKVHFILITDTPSQLLPTILSRAAIYFLKKDSSDEIIADAKIKDLAKRLMVVRGADLVAVADEITKKKIGARAYAMEIIGVAIEMLYRTYFITNKEVFLKKIPRFLAAYEGISRNGHIKLQIVANLC